MNNNNWSEWSIHVLAELKRLNDLNLELSKTLIVNSQILAVNTSELTEHMRRTALLEEDLKPLKKHVAIFEGGLKFLGLLAVIVGLITGAIKLFGG